MGRKLSVLMLAVVMAAALVAPAFADVMWEPYDNDFYETHREECTNENRSYLANGADGYVTLKTAPDSLTEAVNVANGNSLYVGYIWQRNGSDRWAVCDYSVLDENGSWTWYSGWVPLSDLALIYDYIAFEEDHGTEFQQYDGSGDGLTEVCLYSYPGGAYWENLTESEGYMAFADSFQYLYTDENGRRWTFVGYYLGRRNAWVCLDDPLNGELGVDGCRTVAQVRGAEETLTPAAESVPAAKTAVLWVIPAVLVVAVTAVTAVLVRKKKKI